MPQLDASTFPTQLLWLFVTFVVLYVVMAWVAMPRIGTVLEDRQRRIDDQLERASQLKADAEAAMTAYESALAKARAEAQEILRAGSGRLIAESERRQHELGERLAAQIKAGDARIAEAMQHALAEARVSAADVASAIVARLVGTTVDTSRAVQAVTAVADEGR